MTFLRRTGNPYENYEHDSESGRAKYRRPTFPLAVHYGESSGAGQWTLGEYSVHYYEGVSLADFMHLLHPRSFVAIIS